MCRSVHWLNLNELTSAHAAQLHFIIASLTEMPFDVCYWFPSLLLGHEVLALKLKKRGSTQIAGNWNSLREKTNWRFVENITEIPFNVSVTVMYLLENNLKVRVDGSMDIRAEMTYKNNIPLATKDHLNTRVYRRSSRHKGNFLCLFQYDTRLRCVSRSGGNSRVKFWC